MASVNRKTEIIPLEELERYRDADWALHDPEVQREYRGQWVVAFQMQIIAHGPILQDVAGEANRRVINCRHFPVFCEPEDPVSWFEDNLEADGSHTDG